MATVTLISKPQARVGGNFRVIKIPEECYKCKLYNICMGRLRPGRVYRITEVRPLRYPSPYKCLLNGDEMVPVVVEEEDLILPIKLPYVIEGSITLFDKSWCICHPCPSEEALPSRVKVVKIIDKRQCGSGWFFLVEAKPLD
ncbi:UPF0179 family protein [Caldivirga sp.]|uniref:UPF0179 family protein n=1 Tax=Caldivirga sp. TaxID=2080243 RepID=UPI0025C55593|nr:UPF0179 family protein [Caldivirga sp.]